MKRLIYHYLSQWAKSDGRKSLVIRGARQVGKTHAVRALARDFEHFVEINLEKKKEAARIFEGNLDPKLMIRDLGLMLNTTIVPGKTLLFIDEIQEVPRAITALRYFYEEMPDLHVIGAGSLIDFATYKVGMPVGRVSFLYVHPMTFLEFLVAVERSRLVEAILDHDPTKELSEGIHKMLLDLVAVYLAVGGMPEAVLAWKGGADPNQCFEVHQSLINTYRQDFEKYAKDTQLKYLRLILDGVPRQIGYKFQYTKIEGDYRKRELAPCLDLLETAGVVHKVLHTSGNGIPLGAESDYGVFKTFFLDVALGQALLGHDLRTWILNPEESFVNKGKVMEAFVGQEILGYGDPRSRSNFFYWHGDKKTSQAELNYLIQKDYKVLPIEVKSGKGSTLKSLHKFLNTKENSPFGLRISTHNYSVHNSIHSYPLYSVATATSEQKEFLQTLLT